MKSNSLMNKTRSLLCLCKATISVFASLSAVTGFLMVSHSLGAMLAVLVLGVFLMACGACALNHYQERDTDALMARTAGRPLPGGRVKPGHALCFSLLMISSGFIALLFTGTPAPPLLGLAAVLWYNGFYTRFKTRTAFAVIPGALIGAIPPAVGWTAGGGSLLDPRLAVLCFFFFLWQVPHFFFHLLIFGKEYEKISYPSLTAVFTGPQMNRLTCQWLFAAAASLQFIIFFGLLQSFLVKMSLLTASFWLVTQGIKLVRDPNPSYVNAFRGTNYFVFTVMLLIFLDAFPRFLR